MRFSFTQFFFLLFFTIYICGEINAQFKYSFGPSVGFGMANYPHNGASVFLSEGRSNVYAGLGWSVGVVQKAQFGKNWAVELEAAFQQSNFEISEEYTSFDLFNGKTLYHETGHYFKLDNWQFPIRLRYIMPDRNGAFSMFMGLVYEMDRDSKLVFFQNIKDLERAVSSVKINVEEGAIFDDKISTGFWMGNPGRFYFTMGLGRQFGKRFSMDIDAKIPLGKNSVGYELYSTRIIFEGQSTYIIEFNDPTLSLKIAYWIY